MRFRKAIAFILCAVMAFSLVACGKKSPGSGVNSGGGNGEKCTVSFNVGTEALAAGVQNPANVTVTKGSAVGTLPTVTWDSDHTLSGWFDGNTQYTATTVVNSDVTLTAHWDSAAARDEYEQNLAANGLAETGHLYIHYKRYNHSGEGSVNTSAAPTYNDPIAGNEYTDWGLWLWPKNNEGRLFYPARIDLSGAVYDIKLDYDYNDAGWNANTKTHKGLHANYKKMPNAKGVQEEVTSIGFQLFQVSTRKLEGYWKNDGGNNYLAMKEITRDGGDAHWYVSEGNVTTGSAKFSNKELGPDPYEGDTGNFITRASGDKMINSAAVSTYPQVKQRAAGFDSNNGYQIFIASFKDSDGDGMGDLRGIIEELDYLERLGVDVLWLTPFQTSTNYHGYDIKDFFSVDSRFGTLADYRELVYKVHKKGMKIVMDFVLNHTSQSNPWFVKSQNLTKEEAADGTEIDYRQFYSWINKAKYDSLSVADQAQWHGDAHGYYFYSSFSADQPELNYDYQPVRDAILDVCNYWMAFGLDGFRLDAVKHIYMVNELKGVGKSPSGAAGTTPGSDVISDGSYSHDVKRNINFYREFNYKLKKNYPNAFVVGENLDGYNLRTARYYEGMDSQFEFNTYYAGRGFAAIRGINKVSKAGQVQQGQSLDQSSMGSAFNDYIRGYNAFKGVNPGFIGGQFTSNHDLPRARNRMALSGSDGSETDRYADIANGNNTTVINDSYNALYLYYAFLMTLPGVTWTYYGDEIGMLGVMETTVRTGSTDTVNDAIDHEDRIYRQPMKWEQTGNASYSIGFNDAKCELTGYNLTGLPSAKTQEADANSLWNWVKTLNNLRKQYKFGAATNITDNGTNGNKISYKVTTGSGTTIEVTIVAGGSVSTAGAKASKTVTIGGKSCTVVIK
ncbi:MAG: hypothetical protein J1G04_02085 [Clostridiales bacterium]|nr:hypothetical protein [Clostridiales bacterium]